VARSFRQEFWSLPNAITLVRIALIPLFLYFTFDGSRVHSFWASLIFLVTSGTDFVDGWLARRMNLVTVIGKFLDPLADKLIVMSALVMLVHLGRVAEWIVILIMAREFMISGLRTIAMSEGVVIAAGQEGKYKTALQLCAIVFLLLHYTYPVDFIFLTRDVDANRVGTILLYLSTVFSLWSAWVYLANFLRATYRGDAATRAPAGERPPAARAPADGTPIPRPTEP
jgi:CDP-diacylglycerol--glycerol-3-phosphate 3-phosphatidyltransferase